MAKKNFLLLLPLFGLALFAAALGFALYSDMYTKGRLTGLCLASLVLLVLFFFQRERMIVAALTRELGSLLENLEFHDSVIKQPKGLNAFVEKLQRVLAFTVDSIRTTEENSRVSETAAKILEYKKNRLEAVLKGYPDGIMILDESGMPQFANSKVENLTGISPEKAVASNFTEWAEEKELSAFLARYRGNKDRLLRAEKIEYSPAHSKTLTIMAGAYPLFSGEAPESFGTLLVFRDISAEKMAQKARGDFVSQVSHELKSPLNILAMYSETLLSEEGKSESFRVEAVNVIHDEVERLSALIGNLLSISQIEMGSLAITLQRVKVSELLDDAFKRVSRDGREKGITFSLELPPSLSPLSLDKALFNVAVNNLLTNAIKYNKEKGSVTLRAEETEKRVMILVKDTGIGISPEDQDRVFEKFFRSENIGVREISGHGIGLSLAKSIVEMHHGKLFVESIPGKGSTFTIVFEKTEGLIREGI